MPAALPLWVLVYSLSIWGFASLDIGWQGARLLMALALVGLGICLRLGRGRGLALLGCAITLGGLAQARRAPFLEIPALAPIRDPAARPGQVLSVGELLGSAELPPDAQWLCEGRVIDAPSAGEHGFSLRVEVTALRRADGPLDWASYGLPPDSDRFWLRVTPPMAVSVSVRGTPREPLWAGTFIRFVAPLRSPRSAQNPGATDRPRHAAALGIVAVASLDPDALFPWHGAMVAAVSSGPLHAVSLRLARYAEQLRARLVAQITATAPLFPSRQPIFAHSGIAIVAALALGDRGPLIFADQARREAGLPTIDQSFRGAGIYHVLSVSGLHLAVVSLLFYRLLAWLLRWLRPLTDRQVAHRIAALVAILPTLFYALLTGAELATQRAAFAAVLALLAIGCGRRATLSQALAGAVLLIAFPCPLGAGTPALLLCEPSLILSIVATLAITYLRPLGGLPERLKRSRDVETARRALLRWIGRGAWQLTESSLAALLATLPIGALYFSEIQLAGILGNLLPGLLGEFVVLPLGLFGALCGLSWRGAGALVLSVAISAAAWMVRGAAVIANLGGVLNVPAPHPLLILSWWLGLCVLAAGRRRLGYLACAGVLAAYLVVWAAPPRALRITMLDVGQGDAIVIELPGGGVIVVDAGLATPATSAAGAGMTAGPGLDMGSRVVVPFLRRRGHRRIDIIVASHPHPDHTGGLAALVESFPIGELWAVPPPLVPAVASRRSAVDPSWPALLQLARQHGIPIVAPRSQRIAGVALEVLAPCQTDSAGQCLVQGRADWQHNDNSLVLRLGYAGRAVLLPGDIELAGELALLDNNPSIRSDVLKAPHHCSRTSSSESLIAAVQPQWVICSLSAYNHFGFPHKEVLGRYQDLGSHILRTDANGAVSIRIDAAGTMRVKTEVILPLEGP